MPLSDHSAKSHRLAIFTSALICMATVAAIGYSQDDSSSAADYTQNLSPQISEEASVKSFPGDALLWGCFVNQQYRDFLYREADSGGLNFYTSRLAAGSMTPERLVRNFMDSPEFVEINGFLTRCYFGLFNDNSAISFDHPDYRLPDTGGLFFWHWEMQAIIDAGGDAFDAKLFIVYCFLGSAEWGGRDLTMSDAEFVELLYNRILGREPDPGGFAFHLENLEYNLLTREEVVLCFLESPEAREFFQQHTYVTMAYLGLLQRAPERDGFIFHMARLNDGDFDALAFLRNIIYSAEYLDRLASLGCYLPIDLIVIDVTPDEGSWTLEGPAGFTTISGAGDRIGALAIINAPAGEYTLTCDDLTSFTTPLPQTQTLSAGGALVFTPIYFFEGDLLTITLPGDLPLKLVRIPAGSFLMGRYPGELYGQDSEDPQHEVTIEYDYYLGKYELTKGQWQAVMGTTPWSGKDYVLDDLDSPAQWISWEDIVGADGFIETLNEHLADTGQGVARLPSEAEWEYACRAGTTTRHYWGDDLSYTEINDHAWWSYNAFWEREDYAHLVGQKAPNAWGLHDMSGNVEELCQDFYHLSYADGAFRPDDGSAWESPGDYYQSHKYRVIRGGHWKKSAYDCRSAARDQFPFFSTDNIRSPYVGYRICVLFSNSEEGQISIDVTPDEGSWTLAGPSGFTTLTGAGDRVDSEAIKHVPAGEYTLTCNDFSAYTAPAPQTKTLPAGGAITFKAGYIVEGYDPITIMLPGDVPLKMVRIPAGSFLMGRYPGELASSNNEDPQHTVTINYDFYMGKYELTKRQWQAVMGAAPWVGQANVLDDLDSPAVYVSWEDVAGAGGFFETLNAHLTNTGQGVARLPSEAEWEYACRAGTTTRFYWGDDLSAEKIGDFAWWDRNADAIGEDYAHLVGLKLPNAWGLHDMSGNVEEWCQDHWHHDYNDPGRPDDGSAWISSSGDGRVLRGGFWRNNLWWVHRSAFRWPFPRPALLSNDCIGFRVVAFPAGN